MTIDSGGYEIKAGSVEEAWEEHVESVGPAIARAPLEAHVLRLCAIGLPWCEDIPNGRSWRTSYTHTMLNRFPLVGLLTLLTLSACASSETDAAGAQDELTSANAGAVSEPTAQLPKQCEVNDLDGKSVPTNGHTTLFLDGSRGVVNLSNQLWGVYGGPRAFSLIHKTKIHFSTIGVGEHFGEKYLIEFSKPGSDIDQADEIGPGATLKIGDKLQELTFGKYIEYKIGNCF